MKNEFNLVDFETEAIPHMKDLYRTALRLVRLPAEAEDLVQETFTQAWRSFDRYERGTNCRAWLYKILFFKVDHHRRRLQTRSRFFVDADPETVVATVQPIAETQLNEDAAMAALEALPEKFRDVVLLADVREFSYQEIATTLGIPIGTVMSRLSRGRRQLREKLGELARSYGIGMRPGVLKAA
ncbi:MAG: sigma-70 family RNA polymerase sigma factor [Pyrinomonadaceae bacterium]